MFGGAGDDVLNGGAGEDNLDGGAGNDVYLFNRGDGADWIYDQGLDSDVDTLRFGEGIAPQDIEVTRDEWSLYLTLRGTQDVAGLDGWFSDSAGRIERIEFADGTVWEADTLEERIADSTIAGTSGNDRLNGTAGRDVIYGYEGDDVLNGRAGADTMLGGAGDDIYRVDDAGDVVTELADEGADRVISTISYTLGDNVENLTLTGTEAISGTGNALDNVIVGNDASNTLDGLAGDDRLTGGAADDILLGGEGNDVLNGAAGADTMLGGAGDDIYRVDDARRRRYRTGRRRRRPGDLDDQLHAGRQRRESDLDRRGSHQRHRQRARQRHRRQRRLEHARRSGRRRPPHGRRGR